VTKQLEPLYLASCPFCDYRELFSSELKMCAIYGAHLLGHAGDAIDETRLGRKRIAQRMEDVARHLERLNTAPYN
jgi:hypothetical protein